MKIITPELEKLFIVDTLMASLNGRFLSEYMMRKHGWTEAEYHEKKQQYVESVLNVDQSITEPDPYKPKMFFKLYQIMNHSSSNEKSIFELDIEEFGDPNPYFYTITEVEQFLHEHFIDAQPEGVKEAPIGGVINLVALPVFDVIKRIKE